MPDKFIMDWETAREYLSHVYYVHSSDSAMSIGDRAWGYPGRRGYEHHGVVLIGAYRYNTPELGPGTWSVRMVVYHRGDTNFYGITLKPANGSNYLGWQIPKNGGRPLEFIRLEVTQDFYDPFTAVRESTPNDKEPTI